MNPHSRRRSWDVDAQREPVKPANDKSDKFPAVPELQNSYRDDRIYTRMYVPWKYVVLVYIQTHATVRNSLKHRTGTSLLSASSSLGLVLVKPEPAALVQN